MLHIPWCKIVHLLVELISMCMQSYQLNVYFLLIYVIAHNLFMNIDKIRERQEIFIILLN